MSTALASLGIVALGSMSGCGRTPLERAKYKPAEESEAGVYDLALPKGHLAVVSCVDVSPDGMRAVSGGDDGWMLIWDIESREIIHRLRASRGYVSECRFRNDERVVVVGASGLFRTYDIPHGNRTGKPSVLSSISCLASLDSWSLALHEDGKRALVGSRNGAVVLVDMERDICTTLDNADARLRPGILHVGFLSKNRWFAAGDRGLRVGSLDQPGVPEIVSQATAAIGIGRAQPAALFVTRGRTISRVVQRNNKLEEEAKSELPVMSEGSVQGLAVNGAGNLFALGLGGTAASKVAVVEWFGGQSPKVRCEIKTGAEVRSVAFAPDENAIVIGTGDGRVLWSFIEHVVEGRCGRRSLSGDTWGRVRSVAASNSGVVLGDGLGQVSFFDNRWQLAWSDSAHAGEVLSIVSLGPLSFVTSGHDTRLIRHQIDGNHRVVVPRLPVFPWEIMGTAGGDAVWISPPHTGGRVGATLREFDGPANRSTMRVVFNGRILAMAARPAPDGSLTEEFVLGGDDEPTLVHVHDEMQELKGFTAWYKDRTWDGRPSKGIVDLAYTRDGRCVCISHVDGALSVTDLDRPNPELAVADQKAGGRLATSATADGAVQYLWSGSGDHIKGWIIDTKDHRCEATKVADTFVFPQQPGWQGPPIVLDIAARPDNFRLVAGLDDGRAAFFSLPTGGAPVLQFINYVGVMKGGAWMSMDAQGRATIAGPMPMLRPRQVSTPPVLRATPSPSVVNPAREPPRVTATADGASFVQMTIASSTGEPSIEIDGTWPLEPIARANHSGLYDVRFLMDDLSKDAFEGRTKPPTAPEICGNSSEEPIGPKHFITVRRPGSSSNDSPDECHWFTSERPIRGYRAHTDALIIGNEDYANGLEDLPGVRVDARSVVEALGDEHAFDIAGFRTNPDRHWIRNLSSKPDPKQPKPKDGKPAPLLEEQIGHFFSSLRQDHRGATLLFYFAGHARTVDGMGYLLPTDYDPTRGLAGALSAEKLWKLVVGALREDNAAHRIIVVIDACRAGSFALTKQIQAEALHERVAFVASTSEALLAPDPDEGGPFTQGFVKAIKERRPIAEGASSLSIYDAFVGGANQSLAQQPLIFGSSTVLATPIAFRSGASSTVSSLRARGTVVLRAEQRPENQRLVDAVVSIGDDNARWLKIMLTDAKGKAVAKCSLGNMVGCERFVDIQGPIKIEYLIELALAPPGTYKLQVWSCKAKQREQCKFSGMADDWKPILIK